MQKLKKERIKFKKIDVKKLSPTERAIMNLGWAIDVVWKKAGVQCSATSTEPTIEAVTARILGYKPLTKKKR